MFGCKILSIVLFLLLFAQWLIGSLFFAVLQIFLLYILLCINIALFSCWFVCIWLCIDYFVSAKNGVLCPILAAKCAKNRRFLRFLTIFCVKFA